MPAAVGHQPVLDKQHRKREPERLFFKLVLSKGLPQAATQLACHASGTPPLGTHPLCPAAGHATYLPTFKLAWTFTLCCIKEDNPLF